MREGKLYWMSGQLPREGRVAVIIDSSTARLLDEAAADFPIGRLDRPYFHGGVKKILNSDEVYAWFKKWFGVVTKGREE